MREEARGWLGLIYDWRRRSTSYCEAGKLLTAQLWNKELTEKRTPVQVRCAARWPLCPWPRFYVRRAEGTLLRIRLLGTCHRSLRSKRAVQVPPASLERGRQAHEWEWARFRPGLLYGLLKFPMGCSCARAQPALSVSYKAYSLAGRFSNLAETSFSLSLGLIAFLTHFGKVLAFLEPEHGWVPLSRALSSRVPLEPTRFPPR